MGSPVRFRSCPPVFVIVNVLTNEELTKVLSKSVSSLISGDESPLAMTVPFPRTSMSGRGAANASKENAEKLITIRHAVNKLTKRDMIVL